MLLEVDARRILHGILDDLDVRAGAVVMLHVDMGGIPLPDVAVALSRAGIRAQRDAYCRFLLETILSRLGSDGTLIVPTFTYSTTQPGGRFDVETTPAEVGPFPEFARKHAQARRSSHPVFSLAAIGPLACGLVDDCGPAAFGRCSPWQRFSDLGVRIVTLGVPFRKSATYVHHLEQCFGSPHRYNKVLDIPVYRGGKLIHDRWLAYLRFLSIDNDIDLRNLEDRLRSEGRLIEKLWGDHVNSAVTAKSVDETGYAMLHSDPWAFATRSVVMRIKESVQDTGPYTAPVAEFDLKLTTTNPGA